MVAAETERNRSARRLFAPLAGTYDRYAALLSFGQDPRWRRFLVSRLDVRPQDRVLDVATGTAAVAIAVGRRYGCAVVGVDQSPEMLAAARGRAAAAGLADRIRLEQARAEALPFADAAFDAVTVTYLLRYVDDPRATMRELVRVVRPGGTVAMLEFGFPAGALARPLWRFYVHAGLPALGRVVSPGWHGVGRFLGPSIEAFHAAWPGERLLALFGEVGLVDVRARHLSLGGGLVLWGQRGD